MKARITPPKGKAPGMLWLFMSEEEWQQLKKRAKEDGFSNPHDALLHAIEDRVSKSK